MKDTRSIAQQVADMTKEQQEKVLKVGLRPLIFLLAGATVLLVLCILALWIMTKPPAGFSLADYDKLYIGLLITECVGALYVIGVPIVTRSVCPYYSDAKWRFLRRQRKKG